MVVVAVVVVSVATSSTDIQHMASTSTAVLSFDASKAQNKM
jgi:hypothetical protein